MATDLYKKMLDYDYGDDNRRNFMEKIWSGTPWMVDAYTGGYDDDRMRYMVDWCRERFGDEAWPIHGKPGSWQRGRVAFFGWTWFGFATPTQMSEFMAAWPNPENRLRDSEVANREGEDG